MTNNNIFSHLNPTDPRRLTEEATNRLNAAPCCIRHPHSSEAPCYDRYDPTTWN